MKVKRFWWELQWEEKATSLLCRKPEAALVEHYIEGKYQQQCVAALTWKIAAIYGGTETAFAHRKPCFRLPALAVMTVTLVEPRLISRRHRPDGFFAVGRPMVAGMTERTLRRSRA